MEACASAHYWGRQLLELGFAVRLIPPAHVKPYVRRNKNTQPTRRRFVRRQASGPALRSVRSVENQAALMRHRARELMVGQRTAALNALRSHLSEIGVVAAQGVQNAYALKELAVGGVDENGEIVAPDCVRLALLPLVRQIDALDEAIETIDRELQASAKPDETVRRLMTIPGSARSPPLRFSPRSRTSARSPAGASSWLSRTDPSERSTGGKPRLGRDHEDGRPLSAQAAGPGACSALGHRKGHSDALRRWASACSSATVK